MSSKIVLTNCFLLVLVGIFLYLIFTNSFQKDPQNPSEIIPTCDNYVKNTYLYVGLLFSVFLILLYNFVVSKLNIHIMMKLIKNCSANIIICVLGLILILISFYVFFYLIRHTSPVYYIRQFTYLLFLILLLAFLISFLFILPSDYEFIYQALSLTIIIAGIASYIGYHYGEYLISNNLEKLMTWYFILLLIPFFIFVIFAARYLNPYQYYLGVYIFSILFIIGIVFFIILQHKKIKENSQNCDPIKNPANYPFESISILTRLINLFTNLLNLLQVRKGLRVLKR